MMHPDGHFLAVDLGDNYPRGVHVHEFPAKGQWSSDTKRGRLVYQFKTRHGESEASPAGKKYAKYVIVSDAQLWPAIRVF